MDRILIVEDIPSVKIYIQRLLEDYHCSDVELAAAVENGVEALAVMKEQPVDILITDVFMPQMNGLELMEQASAINPRMKMIVISAYDQYAYVRSAMRLNACEYLLKPVSKHDFDVTLDNVRKQLQSEREELESNERILREREAYRKSAVLQKYLDGNADANNPLINRIRRNWTIVAIVSDPKLFTNVDFMRSLASKGVYASFISEKPIQYVVVFQKTSEDDIRQWIKRGTVLSANLHYPAYFAYERYREDQKELTEGYRLARRKLHARFLHDPPTEASHADVSYLTDNDALFLQCHLPLQSESEINVTLNRYFSAIESDTGRSYRQIWNFFNRLQQIYLSICKVNDVDFLSEREGLCDLRLCDCIDLDHAQQLMIRQFTNLSRLTKRDAMSRSAQIVKSIQNHVEKKCSEDIHLQDIARILFLNEDYLSKLFRSVTGETFSKYLTRVRMERACKLILETDMKITDITAAVGYNSTSNFIMVFRKQFGQTPAQMRMKHK